jgi:hypothetical protein
MSFDAVLSDLRSMYGAYLLPATDPDVRLVRLTEDNVKRWDELAGGTRKSLYGEIALYLARGFHASELTFDFCDWIANDLFGIMTSGPESDWSEDFYEVYSAFDEGEHSRSDKPGEDPIEAYTRPLIARIVTGISS